MADVPVKRKEPAVEGTQDPERDMSFEHWAALGAEILAREMAKGTPAISSTEFAHYFTAAIRPHEVAFVERLAERIFQAHLARIRAAAATGLGEEADVWKHVVPQTPIPVESIVDRTIEVMGSRDNAMRWLGTPVQALDFATPISMLATDDGVEKVLGVLGQMEHGVW